MWKPGAALTLLRISSAPSGNAGHAQRVFGGGDAARLPAGAHVGQGVVVHRDAHAEGLRHGIGGHVVMGRPDPARGEQQVIAPAQAAVQGADRLDDQVLFVGDNADFLQVDPDRRQHARQMMGIAFAGPARQDFVADDQDGGGLVIRLHGHLRSRAKLTRARNKRAGTSGAGTSGQAWLCLGQRKVKP
jgi:hypothetical protein